MPLKTLKLFFVSLPFSILIEGASFSYTVSGTPPRKEIESKFAFEINKDFDDKEFTSEIHQLITKNLKKFQFGKNSLCKMSIDSTPQSFAFLDYYYDTNDQDILKASSAYRLRYRWSNFMDYVRSRLFPVSSLFRPTRVEIQSKIGYKETEDGKLETTETRFEFRKEASPFIDGARLPPIDWAHENYENVLTSGTYLGYKIYPKVVLEDELKVSGDLANTVTLLTKRNRMHINCKSPFGTGPNPDQLFIITADRIYCEKGCSDSYKPSIEIEIERERNTSTMLDTIASYTEPDVFGNELIAKEAIEYAKSVKAVYDSDHLFLSYLVRSYLKGQDLKILTPNYKYKRFAKK